MYSSTCFGRPHAHHQELNNCSSSFWFYRWSVVIAVLLVMVGLVRRLVGWLVDWLVDQSVVWLAGRSVGWLVGRFVLVGSKVG
jgi:hypothetical protein